MSDNFLSRRRFISSLSKYGIVLGGSALLLSKASGAEKLLEYINARVSDDFKAELYKNAPLARYWTSTAAKNANCLSCHAPKELTSKTHSHKEKLIKCLLCAQGCLLKENEHGKCRGRINVNGEMHSLVYGRPIAIHIDCRVCLRAGPRRRAS